MYRSRRPYLKGLIYLLFLNYLGSIGVSYRPDKIFLMYPRSWSSDVWFLHSSSVVRDSFVVSLICPTCTITVVISTLYLIFNKNLYLWCICNGTSSAFISTYLSASMRSDMPCFQITTIDSLIDISCRIIDSCYTLCCLSHNYLHTLCIRIDLQHPS